MFPYSFFFYRNVEKLGIILREFSYGKLYEIQSIKTTLFDITNTSFFANHRKLDWYAQIKNLQDI